MGGIDNIQDLQDQAREDALRRAKALATGLFVAVAMIFLACRLLRVRYHWLGPVEAFSEAAMVGAIADWFAVTALFRRPLGIPWHTEIIPRKKEAIGRNIGRFIDENFLSRRVIYMRLRDSALSEQLARWVLRPGNSALVAGELAGFLAGLMKFISDEEVRRFVSGSLLSGNRLAKLDPARWLGAFLGLLMAEGRHHRVFDEALEFLRESLLDNRDIILDRINRRSYWFIPSFVDKKLFRDIVRMMDDFFDEVAGDPTHEIRVRFNASMRGLAERLKVSKEFRRKVESLVEGLMENPEAREFAGDVWADLRRRGMASLGNPDSTMRGDMERFVVHTAERLLEDKPMQRAMDRMLVRFILYLAGQYRDGISSFVASQIGGWGGREITAKLEQHVGPDLQYIRINGTLIGGLAGVLIWVLADFIGP